MSYNYYDDIILFEVEHPVYYDIEGEKVSYAVFFEKPINTVVPKQQIESGYIRLNGTVYPCNETIFEERYVTPESDEKYFAISILYGSLQIAQNDNLFCAFQKKVITRESIITFKKKLKKSKNVMRWF